MGEKRRSRRHARRLRVRFGAHAEEGFPHVGITADVSSTGLFIITTQRVTPGERLHVEVTLQGEKPLFAEVVVARKVDVPPELRQVFHTGFGARFLTGDEVMGELVPSLVGGANHRAPSPVAAPGRAPGVGSTPTPVPAQPAPSRPRHDPFSLVYETPMAWRQAVDSELKRGGVFLWCPTAQASNVVLTVTFELPFVGKTLQLPARVVHSAPGPDGRHGVALMFTDPGAVATLTAAAG